GPACYEELWYLLLIDVFVDRRVRRRAEWIEQERDAILLYQPSRLLDRLGRAVCVVIRDKIQLATIDAALLVDHAEIRGLRLASGRIRRGGTAIRIGVAELDLFVGDARRLFRAGDRGGGRGEGQSSSATKQ